MGPLDDYIVEPSESDPFATEPRDPPTAADDWGFATSEGVTNQRHSNKERLLKDPEITAAAKVAKTYYDRNRAKNRGQLETLDESYGAGMQPEPGFADPGQLNNWFMDGLYASEWSITGAMLESGNTAGMDPNDALVLKRGVDKFNETKLPFMDSASKGLPWIMADMPFYLVGGGPAATVGNVVGKATYRGLAAYSNLLGNVGSKVTKVATIAGAEAGMEEGLRAGVQEQRRAENEQRDYDWSVPATAAATGAAVGAVAGPLIGGAPAIARGAVKAVEGLDKIMASNPGVRVVDDQGRLLNPADGTYEDGADVRVMPHLGQGGQSNTFFKQTVNYFDGDTRVGYKDNGTQYPFIYPRENILFSPDEINAIRKYNTNLTNKIQSYRYATLSKQGGKLGATPEPIAQRRKRLAEVNAQERQLEEAKRNASPDDVKKINRQLREVQEARRAIINPPDEVPMEGGAPDTPPRGEHRPADADYGAPAHNVENFYPGIDDAKVREGYVTAPKPPPRVKGVKRTREQISQESQMKKDYEAEQTVWRAVERLKGKPRHVIKMYRAVPEGSGGSIEPGDWITPSKRYAEQHAERSIEGPYEIVEKTVMSNDVYTSGDSIMEWGYDPQPMPLDVKHTLKKGVESAPEQALEWNGRPLHEWTGQDFKEFGDAHGVPNLGPLSEVALMADANGNEYLIPGGIRGTFTYLDMLWLKNNPIDPSEMDSGLHRQLALKMAKSTEPLDPTDDVEFFSRLAFGMLSPNQPLTPNEFSAARIRPRNAEELQKLADFIPWEPGKGVETIDPELRARVDVEIAEYFQLQAGEQGGLGVRSSGNTLAGYAELAKMYLRDPAFFRYDPTQGTWFDYINKLQSTITGGDSKVAIFTTVWQDPSRAAVSAVDRHMAGDFLDELLDTAEKVTEFNESVVTLWNGRVDTYNAEQRAAYELAIAEGTRAKLPVPRQPADNLDQVMVQTGSDGVFMERAMALVGKDKTATLQPASGVVTDPRVPEELRTAEGWPGALPPKYKMISDNYRRALEINERHAKENGLDLFNSQWMLWDRIRRRLEPHEPMYPGLHKLPRGPAEQMQQAMAYHSWLGFMDYAKQDWLDPVSNEMKWRMKPTKPGDRLPSWAAYFGMVTAATPMITPDQDYDGPQPD